MAHPLLCARGMKQCIWVVLVACGSDPVGGPEPVTSGAYHHYVTSALRIPVTPELQREFALDVDGDAAGKPDNQLGNVFVALTSSSDADLQGEIDGAVAAGLLVLLHSVRADDLAADRSVSWQVYAGADHAGSPAFDGSDTFVLAAAAPPSEPMLGVTTAGHFEALGAGRLAVKLAVSPDAPPLALDLINARAEVDVDAAGCTGRLGGAVTQQEVDTQLIPTVVEMMNAAIARDPGCPAACTEGTSAALIIEVFDTDMDGVITEAELRTSEIIQTLLAPDLDLLEPIGVADSISLGVGFECVAAAFDAGEQP